MTRKPGEARRSGRRGTRKTASRPTNEVGRSTNTIGGRGWAELFASKTLVALLKMLLMNPDNTFFQRELADAAGTGLYAVQRELARLERAGLVVRTRRGNRVYYKADRSHPAFEDLKRVVLKTVGLGDARRAALAPLAGRVRVAFLYGSYASGQETPGSDLDLLLVGDLTLREAAALLGPVTRDVGREFNPAVYPPDEFKKKAVEGHHFITDVLKGPKVFLIGDENDLEDLVG